MYIRSDSSLVPDDADLLLQDTDRRLSCARSVSSNELMEILAYDPNHGVRSALASNPNISPDVLRKLADDDDVGVRMTVAYNKRITLDIMEKFLDDPNQYVRAAMATNPSVSGHILDILANEDSAAVVRDTAKRNPNYGL